MDTVDEPNGVPAGRFIFDKTAGELIFRVPISAAEPPNILDNLPHCTSITVNPVKHRLDTSSGSMTVGFSASWRPFKFLSLPPETRNNIYKRLFLVSDKEHPVEVRKERKTGKLDSTKYMMPWTVWDAGIGPMKLLSAKNLAGLLGVNRMLHQECLAYLYGENYFYFTQASGLQSMLDRGCGILQFLRHVHVGNMTSSGKPSRSAILGYLKDAYSLMSFKMTGLGNLGGKLVKDWIQEDIAKIYPVVNRLQKNHGGCLDAGLAAFHIPNYCRCTNCPDGPDCINTVRLLKTMCEMQAKKLKKIEVDKRIMLKVKLKLKRKRNVHKTDSKVSKR